MNSPRNNLSMFVGLHSKGLNPIVVGATMLMFLLVGTSAAGAQVHYLVAAGPQHSIREYDANGDYLGDFVTFVRNPSLMAYGPDGHLYVSSFSTHAVLRFHGVTGQPMGVAASGTGLFNPVTISFDPDGTLVVSWWTGGRITRHDPDKNQLIGDVIDPAATNSVDGRLWYELGGERFLLVGASLDHKVMRFHENGTKESDFLT